MLQVATILDYRMYTEYAQWLDYYDSHRLNG